MIRNKALSQFFTPIWAAELIFDSNFNHLSPGDLIWEPTCGSGALLSAIPAYYKAIGTEIDPILCKEARIRTGRPVIEGNALTVNFDGIHHVKAIYGNPPFSLQFFERLLIRCASILSTGNKAVFILPTYFFQTSRTVIQLGRKWHIYQQLLPRDIFPSLSKPLTLGTFIREDQPMLFGFSLYQETADLTIMEDEAKEIIRYQVNGIRSIWKNLVSSTLSDLGGTASLESIYNKIETKRPTNNPFWREQIRKVCSENFTRIEKGVYAL